MNSFLNVPEPTAQSLFFPYDEEEKRFRSTFYEEGMTCNQITKKEVKTFFDGLNHFSPDFVETEKFPRFVIYMMGSGLASLVLGCIIIFYGRFHIYSQALSIVGILFIVLGLYLGYSAVNKFFENSEELTQQTRGRITNYVNENSNPFKSKNLHWKVPEEHYDWIELTLAPNAKSKSLFSDKETRITMGDSTRRDDSTMDFQQNGSRPLLSQL